MSEIVKVLRSRDSREVAREKVLALLDTSLAPGGTGGMVGETGAWLLAHASVLFVEAGQEFDWYRNSMASHALIACRHKVVFGMASGQDLSGIVKMCRQLARIYATVGEEVEGKLPPETWADPRPSWKALELGVVGAASAASAALRYEGGVSEAQECMELAMALLEMGAQMALWEEDFPSAWENWAAIAMSELTLKDFDPMRVVPLSQFKSMAQTLEAIAGAYTLGKGFDWAFSNEANLN